jgi:protein-tyrosine phosphatase
VVWRYPSIAQLEGEGEVEKPEPQDIHEIAGRVITLPKPGEPVHESHAADWRGDNVVRESRDDQEYVENYGVDNPPSSPHETKEIKVAHHTLATEASVTAASAVTSAVKKVSHLGRELGLRQQTDSSKDVSLASSVEDLSQSQKAAKRETESSPLRKQDLNEDEGNNSEMEGVKPFYENGNGHGDGKPNS